MATSFLVIDFSDLILVFRYSY